MQREQLRHSHSVGPFDTLLRIGQLLHEVIGQIVGVHVRDVDIVTMLIKSGDWIQFDAEAVICWLGYSDGLGIVWILSLDMAFMFEDRSAQIGRVFETVLRIVVPLAVVSDPIVSPARLVNSEPSNRVLSIRI